MTVPGRPPRPAATVRLGRCGHGVSARDVVLLPRAVTGTIHGFHSDTLTASQAAGEHRVGPGVGRGLAPPSAPCRWVSPTPWPKDVS